MVLYLLEICLFHLKMFVLEVQTVVLLIMWLSVNELNSYERNWMDVLVRWYRHFYSCESNRQYTNKCNTFSCYDCRCVRIVCVFQTSFVDDWFGRLTFALIEFWIRWGDFFLFIYSKLSIELPTKMNFKY